MKIPRPPYYRKFERVPYSANNWATDEVLNRGDKTGSGARLYDYYKMAELVKQLPNASERVKFVNPYQRSWMPTEKKWHRAWMPALIVPRKAWQVSSSPRYFDTLNFYKYITKTRVLDGDDAKSTFDEYYKSISLPTDKFKKRVDELILFYLCSPDEENRLENRTKFLRLLLEEAYFNVVNFKNMSHRISHSPRCESFWIRSGFDKFYLKQNIWSPEILPDKTWFPGDDVRCTGELSFTLRDKFTSIVRSENPLKNVFSWSETEKLEAPIFSEEIDLDRDVIFNPKIYNLNLDSEILWQCPGYDVDVEETHKYGCVAIKDCSDLDEQINDWKPDSEEERREMKLEALTSTAVASTFSWLNGQAHCIGHTQYTDIEKPITSQMIISNGKEFFFVLGQLNTIAINIDVEGFVNNKVNFCCVDGPYNLFEDEQETVINDHVLQRVLQSICV